MRAVEDMLTWMSCNAMYQKNLLGFFKLMPIQSNTPCCTNTFLPIFLRWCPFNPIPQLHQFLCDVFLSTFLVFFLFCCFFIQLPYLPKFFFFFFLICSHFFPFPLFPPFFRPRTFFFFFEPPATRRCMGCCSCNIVGACDKTILVSF